MKFKFVLILTILFFSGTTWASADDKDGYNGIAWGTALKDFKSAHSSRPNFGLGRIEQQAYQYLMMNFHEAAPNDPVFLNHTQDEKIAGDSADYVFYKGLYRLAVVPISPDQADPTLKDLAARYSKKELKTYTTHGDFEGDAGWMTVEFDYQRYAQTPGASVFCVTASTYIEDQAVAEANSPAANVVVHEPGPKTSLGVFLIYISDDYFKSPDNAWVEYQSEKR
jgi:hypothetical protein